MKTYIKRLIFICALVTILSVLITIRPALIDFSRWQGWHAALHAPFFPDFGHAGRPPVPSRSVFADRARESKDVPTDAVLYYRNDESRSGIDREHQVSPHLHLGARFENLNVGMHTASKSTPIIDESGIYVGADSGWFYAFDLHFNIRWRFHAARPERGIHGTPVVTRTKVCFGSYGGAFYCLRKSNGEVIWTMAMPTSSYGSSPLTVDGDLLMAFETGSPINALVARVNLDDGTLIWESDWVGEQAHSSITLDRARHRAFFGANNSLVRAINTDTGEFLWSRALGGAVKGTTLYSSGALYATSWAATLNKINPDNGDLIWKVNLESPSRSTPTLIPDSQILVVGSKRAIWGINADTGKIAWRRSVDFEIASSAAAIKDPQSKKWLTWIACGARELCAFDAEGRELAKINLPGRLTGAVTAYGSSLYLALDFPGGLVRLDP